MQKKRIIMAATVVAFGIGLTGCGLFESGINDIKGSITGNTYNIAFIPIPATTSEYDRREN